MTKPLDVLSNSFITDHIAFSRRTGNDCLCSHCLNARKLYSPSAEFSQLSFNFTEPLYKAKRKY